MDLPANYEKHLISCQLCEKVLVKPKVLTCLHSFCSSCLLEYLKNIPEDELSKCSFHCPSCRTIIKLPVSEIPVESWLPLISNSSLMVTLIEKVSLQEAKYCDPCKRGNEDTDAVSWCYDCGEALCERCTVYHQRMKILMEHNVVSLQEIRDNSCKAADTEELCQSHAGKAVEAFCFDHDQLCCLDCVTYDHRTCKKVQSLNETAQGTKDGKMMEFVIERLKWVENHALSVIRDRSCTMDDLKQKQDAILSDVALLRNEVEKLLQEMELKLKEELAKMHTALTEELTFQSKDFEHIYKSVDNGKKVLTVSKSLGSERELYITTHKLKKRCEAHEDFVKSESGKVYKYNYEFIVDDVINQFTQNVLSVGKINILRAPSNILPAFMKDMRIEKSIEMSGKSPSDIGHCWFTGGKFISNGFLVLADNRNKKLKCFDKEGTMVSEIGLPGKPWDLCELSPGTLIVTAPDELNCYLVSFSDAGILSLEKETIATQTGCHSIQLKNERLYLACSNEIRILTIDGTVQKINSLRNRGTRYIFVDDNNIMFTDKTGVNSKTLTGRKVFTYKDIGLRSPRGFTQDSEGNIYVCGMDSNNVHQLSKDGTLNKILLTKKDGIKNPYAIGFAPGTTKMFLTQMDCDMIYLYQLVTQW